MNKTHACELFPAQLAKLYSNHKLNLDKTLSFVYFEVFKLSVFLD